MELITTHRNMQEIRAPSAYVQKGQNPIYTGEVGACSSSAVAPRGGTWADARSVASALFPCDATYWGKTGDVLDSARHTTQTAWAAS